jgi:hypothetical protein
MCVRFQENVRLQDAIAASLVLSDKTISVLSGPAKTHVLWYECAFYLIKPIVDFHQILF